MLTQVIDESMRVFWEFLEADKDEANVILKGIQSTNHVDLQDPSDSEFLMEIKTILQKVCFLTVLASSFLFSFSVYFFPRFGFSFVHIHGLTALMDYHSLRFGNALSSFS